MSLQLVRAKLLAVGLFALSACGTVALFSSVPVIARILSDDQPSRPAQSQAFPRQTDGLRLSDAFNSVVR